MCIRVYHKAKQPSAENVCGNNNGGCSEMCLPSPEIYPGFPKYTCAYADDSLSTTTVQAVVDTTEEATTTSAMSVSADAGTIEPEYPESENNDAIIAGGVILGVAALIAIIASLAGVV